MEGKTARTTKRTRAAVGKRVPLHSASGIALETDMNEVSDQSFPEAARELVDTAIRHRMISEAAYHRYVDRGYVGGYDLDDWLQAEAQIEHTLLNRSATDGHA